MTSVDLKKSRLFLLALLFAVPFASAREGPQTPAPATPATVPAATAAVPAATGEPAAPPAPRADAAAAQALLDAIRTLDIANRFAARVESHGLLQDEKLDVRWSLTGDLVWDPAFIHEFHLAPVGSGERTVHGLSTGAQRYLAFTDEGRFATRPMSHLDPGLSAIFAGTVGERFLFNSLHRIARLLAAPPVPPAPGLPGAAPNAAAADPIRAVWGACKITREPAADNALKFSVTLEPDLLDRLFLHFDGRTVTITADRSQREAKRLQGTVPAEGGAPKPGLMTYTESWTCAAPPEKFLPEWTVPVDVEGKPFKEITLNAFGRDRLADQLVGQPAPALVVDSYPPVQDIGFGPGLPGGWSGLPGVVAPRIVPGFAPLPTTGPKEIDWSEEPAKAAKIVDHPVTLNDLLKRYPNRPVAVVFLAVWSTEAQAALADLAQWQTANPPILLVCHETMQTFIDDLSRRGLAVSVCRDPQGRNGVRYGVDAYPMIFVIDADRKVQSVLRGWTPEIVNKLKGLLKLP